jgi:hypothetical protein
MVTLTDGAPPTVVAAVTEIAANSITLTSVLLDGQTVDEETGDITPEYPDTTGYVIVRGKSYNFTLAQIVDTQYVDSLPFVYTGLKHNSQVYFRIAAKDAFFDAFRSMSGLNFSAPQVLTTSGESPYVDPPVITSPEPEAKDVGLRIPVEFTVDRDGDTLVQAQLQASTAQNFASVAYDSGLVNYAPALTTGVLSKRTTYYLRVRVNGQTCGLSGWSDPVKVTTAPIDIGEAFTFNASDDFLVPVTGGYTLEAAGGGAGGIEMYGVYFGPSEVWVYGRGGNGGYAKSVNVQLTKGQDITITVGAGGAGKYQRWDQLAWNGEVYSGSGGTSSIAGYVTGNGGGGARGYMEWVQNSGGSGEDYWDNSRYEPRTVNGSNGGASVGNNANTTGGGSAGGNGNAKGANGWCRITYTG